MTTATEAIELLLKGIPGVQATGVGDPLQNPQLLPEVVSYPAHFTYPIARESNGNQLATLAVRQTRTKFFRVVTLCDIAQYDAIEEALFQALIGKVVEPGATVSEIIHVRGNITSLTGNLCHWQNDFSYRVSPTYNSSL